MIAADSSQYAVIISAVRRVVLKEDSIGENLRTWQVVDKYFEKMARRTSARVYIDVM